MEFSQVRDMKKPVKILLYGKPGSGKTYVSLMIGKVINQITHKPIAVVDTENGRSAVKRRYPEFDYDWRVVCLTSPVSEDYIEAITSAQQQGYGAIILDSISPEWDSVVDRQAAMKGNSFTAWGAAKKPHKKFIATIINANIPVICTCRAKVQYEIVDGKPKALGMAPVQNGDIVYEFDVAISLDDGVVSSVDKQEMDILSHCVGMRLTEDSIIRVLDWYGWYAHQSPKTQPSSDQVSKPQQQPQQPQQPQRPQQQQQPQQSKQPQQPQQPQQPSKHKYIQRILQLAESLNKPIDIDSLESSSIEELTQLGISLRNELDRLNEDREVEYDEEYYDDEEGDAEYDEEEYDDEEADAEYDEADDVE